MFTGIIEEIGKISSIHPIAGGMRMKISSSKILDDISVDDSICVSGVCLTAIKVEDDGFWVEAVGATLEKTTFSKMQLSSSVNLERSMRLNDRLGGHFVQGHTNGTGTILEINKLGENYFLKMKVLKNILSKKDQLQLMVLVLPLQNLMVPKLEYLLYLIPGTTPLFNIKRLGIKLMLKPMCLQNISKSCLGKMGLMIILT